MLRHGIHYGFHFIVPLLIAYFLFPKQWKKAYLILLATMLIDVDHLLANPVFDANRCSINTHILHSYYLIPLYGMLLFSPKFRIIGFGILFHLLTDQIDCWMM